MLKLEESVSAWCVRTYVYECVLACVSSAADGDDDVVVVVGKATRCFERAEYARTRCFTAPRYRVRER